MKTRGQLRREQEQLQSKKNQKNKKTKKQLLEEKTKQQDKDLGGRAISKKVVKEQKIDTRTRRSKKEPIRISNEKAKPQAKTKGSKNISSDKRKSEQRKQKSKQSDNELPSRSRKKPIKQQDKQKKKDTSQPSTKMRGKSDLKDKQQQKIKTIQFKGKVPIDQYCELKSSDHHILQYQGKVYSATLNQTSVSNNNNKFYILQIIQKDNNPNSCYFYIRWGRVGVRGQFSLMGPYSAIVAIRQYNSKYHSKHIKGGYKQIQLNYEDQDQNKQDNKKDDNNESLNNSLTNKKDKDFENSSLSTAVKNLIDLIFDLKMMNKQMIQIGYDPKKMPLGKLSKNSIMIGYNILRKLQDEVTGKKRIEIITQLSGQFYTYIPHDFGFQKMIYFNLDTQQKVKQKIEMLQALAQIKIATSLLNNSAVDQNQIDSNYKKLNRDIKDIQKKSKEFQIINQYLQTTHGKTHKSYDLELIDLFSLNSQKQNQRYTKDIHNKTLLWHGSRLTNFVGILSQGLRIAPPQAPVTGYMFGKGVYFADMSSKSANYCFTSRQNSTGILLLCEVALGQMNEKFHADYYASNLPPGKHSTKGMGRTAPNPDNAVKLDDGVVVPMGPGEQVALACVLQYNQFIVYDIAQIKVRYLLRTKFNYR